MCKVYVFYITSQGKIVCEYDLNIELKIKQYVMWKIETLFLLLSYYYDNAL